MAQIQTQESLLHAPVRELPYFEGVCFDADTDTLHGNYTDELSAYRARKGWKESLRLTFGLEDGFDFISVIETSNHNTYVVSCRFISASGKYAFWKITNNRSPESQYVIETAHIPVCDNRYEDILKAPDMRSIFSLVAEKSLSLPREQSKLRKILRKIQQA